MRTFILDMLIIFACLFGAALLSLRLHAAEVVLRLHGARRVHAEESPTLHRVVHRLSTAAGIAAPRIYAIDMREHRAFAIRGRAGAAIVVTTGMLESPDGHDAVAMIGNEIAHLLHGHTPRADAFAVFASIVDAAFAGARRHSRAVQLRRLVARELRMHRASARRRAAAQQEAERLLGRSPQKWRHDSRYFPRSKTRMVRRASEAEHRYRGSPLMPRVQAEP